MMALSLIVLTAAGGFLISIQRASTVASGTSSNTRVASVAMREMQRMFRVATNNPVNLGQNTQYSFQYASATSVRFFAYVNLNSTTQIQPTEVQFTLNSTTGVLTETKLFGTATDSTNSYWTFPTATTATISTAPSSQVTLATNVVPGTLFTYQDANNNTLTPTASGLSATDLTNVAGAVLSITVGSSTAASQAAQNNVTLTNTVDMPNLILGS